jgi:uncharacterized membrane protein YbhN (UPF0104 family)
MIATARRHRRQALTVIVSIAVTGALIAVIAGRWDEFVAAITAAPAGIVAIAVVLQLIALVARSEAWNVCVHAAGATVSRRRLYRASSMGYVGSVLNSQLGMAARIAALRRTAPGECPRVPALIAAELPIVTLEATLAALTSFTLVGPLGLPWWAPVLCVAATVGLGAGLRSLSRAKARGLWTGLAIMRTLQGRSRLLAFVLIAVLAQIARNWLFLNAVGVEASIFDAIAVLIALVTLSTLPVGPGVGAAATVLILGPHGVAAAAAAGVLLTATGTAGGLAFAGWAGLDRVWSGQRAQAAINRLRARASRSGATGLALWTVLAELPAPQRTAIERAYFGGLSHIQIGRALRVPSAA